MPRRDDLESILLIGSGPIVIGQACEFDYSGTQACRVLREEGYRVILANSNPATIMTDPDFADATYIEPLVADVLERIIAKERPDAVLPTLGGQTALNLAMELDANGVLEAYGAELIGANAEAISTAEDREKFKQAMIEIGLTVPASATAHTMDEARACVGELGLPVVIRPAYILGGKGTGIASTPEEFEMMAARGLEASPISEILIEKSIAGWKEFELEVMRDRADNCVIICSIENVDPMGVHTGDSITVAPAQTLTDVEYQQMRDAAFACIRRVGVETGGSNVQFAVHPETGEQVVIEMNPRVSRSSALASKATGFPIAKIAAKLAVGYTLDEIPNDITKKTPASFEPTIDYVVTKMPRWAFEKFPGAEPTLGTQMQSVGEVMAIGRTFPESLQKAMRSLEQGRGGLNGDPAESQFDEVPTPPAARPQAAVATPDRIFEVESLLRRGVPLDEVHEVTRIDPWFLDQMLAIVEEREHLESLGTGTRGARGDGPQVVAAGQAHGLRRRAARVTSGGSTEDDGPRGAARCRRRGHLQDRRHLRRRVRGRDAVPLRHLRGRERGRPVGPREGHHPRLGPEPDRPGHRVRLLLRARLLRARGRRLRDDHGQLQPRDRLDRLRHVATACTSSRCPPRACSTSSRPSAAPPSRAAAASPASIVSLGGQTPLKLAGVLPPELVLGTSPASIDAAEDRNRWGALCARLEIPQPAGATATTLEEAIATTERIGFPALVRPSYVLGGRAMEIVYDVDDLTRAWEAITLSGSLGPRGRALRRAAGADRPLPRGRHRGRRRRHPRPHRRGDHRRHHGARRGGRRALGRLGLRHPAGGPLRRRRSRSSRTTPAGSPRRSRCGASSTCSSR